MRLIDTGLFRRVRSPPVYNNNLTKLNAILTTAEDSQMAVDEKIKKLENIVKLVDESVTRTEFTDAFKAVIKTITDIKIALFESFATLSNQFKAEKAELFTELQGQVKDTVDTQIQRIEVKLATVKDGYTPVKGKDYRDGIDGTNPEPQEVAEIVLAGLPPYPVIPEQLLGEDFRNALESLQGEDRLDAAAIKNLPEMVKQNYPTAGVQTASALYSLADVDLAGIVSGQSIIWTGIRWIPFTPASSSGGYQQPTSGIVNGINTIFVFATAPNALSVDGGRAIQKVSSDGTVNWTVAGTGPYTLTLSIAPNSDIFAIS